MLTSYQATGKKSLTPQSTTKTSKAKIKCDRCKSYDDAVSFCQDCDHRLCRKHEEVKKNYKTSSCIHQKVMVDVGLSHKPACIGLN